MESRPPAARTDSRRWRICVLGSGLRLCEDVPNAAPVFLDTKLSDGNDARLLALLLFAKNNKRTYAQCVSAMRTRASRRADVSENDPTRGVRKACERLQEKLEPFSARGLAPLVGHDGQCIVLHRAAFTSDIEQSELLFQAARQAEPHAEQAYRAFLAFCGRGDLFRLA